MLSARRAINMMDKRRPARRRHGNICRSRNSAPAFLRIPTIAAGDSD